MNTFATIDIFNIVKTAGKLRILDQTLINTADEIGRLVSAKSQMEREVESSKKSLTHDAIQFEREQYQDTDNKS